MMLHDLPTRRCDETAFVLHVRSAVSLSGSRSPAARASWTLLAKDEEVERTKPLTEGT